MQLFNYLDLKFSQRSLQPFIVAVADGSVPRYENVWRDSSFYGNFEQYVHTDLVTEIDNAYRTQRSAAGRAIFGHGFGGLGAILNAVKHPEIFGLCAALSPPVNFVFDGAEYGQGYNLTVGMLYEQNNYGTLVSHESTQDTSQF